MRIDQLSDKVDAQELEIEQLRSALEYKQKVLSLEFYICLPFFYCTFSNFKLIIFSYIKT